MLVHGLDVRIIDAATGELRRHLTIEPARDYNPAESPAGAHEKALNLQRGFRAIRMSCNITSEPMTGIEPAYSAWEAVSTYERRFDNAC